MCWPRDIDGPYDVVVVGSKAYDLDATMDSFAPAVGPNTVILPLLNGMKHIDQLVERFGDERVLGGLCMISATLDDEGRVLHLNDMHGLSYGERAGGRSARVDAIAAQFAGAKFDATASETIAQDMWEKWVFIASAAGLTSLMRATIGDIVAAGGQDVALSIFDECCAIAAHNGFAPRPAAIQRGRAVVTTAGSPMTASMYKDMVRGAAVEADHIVGDLLGRAPQSGSGDSGGSQFRRFAGAHGAARRLRPPQGLRGPARPRGRLTRMADALAFLHTAQPHVQTFGRLVRDMAPDLDVRHLVMEELLADARVVGVDNAALVQRVQEAMREAASDGAAVVVCTCSTIGGIAEKTATGGAFSALRIDRAMADRAVRTGPRVLIVAAVESTLEPTTALILSAATQAGVGTRPSALLVQEAWAHFQAGDTGRYVETLAAAIRSAVGKADVVVLAQASMAPVTPLLADLGIDVLSSPGLGVAHAVATLRASGNAWTAGSMGMLYGPQG
jgi:2-dehydropantoate 2-reductase